MSWSDFTAWAALALIPLTAVLGVVLRRMRAGSFVRRMRPHFWTGYAAVILALVHVWTTVGSMAGANGAGIVFATIALVGLFVLAFLGTNLQSPGIYRAPLRRWHVVTFVVVLGLALAHVTISASGQ